MARFSERYKEGDSKDPASTSIAETLLGVLMQRYMTCDGSSQGDQEWVCSLLTVAVGIGRSRRNADGVFGSLTQL